MADIYSRSKRSQIMSSVRSTGNRSTELAAIRYFREQGLSGWRRHLDLSGTPDFCFPDAKVAVFVDGCFWHGCPKHYKAPKTNKRFWRERVEKNIRRDRRVDRQLRKAGWSIIRIWEHELRNPSGRLESRLRRALARRSHKNEMMSE